MLSKAVNAQFPLPQKPSAPANAPQKMDQLHKERREFLLKLIRQNNPCTQAYLERETELSLTRHALDMIAEELHNEGLITRYVNGNYCYEAY